MHWQQACFRRILHRQSPHLAKREDRLPYHRADDGSRRHTLSPSGVPSPLLLTRHPCRERALSRHVLVSHSLPSNHTTCSSLTTPARPALVILGLKKGIAVCSTALWIAEWALPRDEGQLKPSSMPYLNMPSRPGHSLWKRISSTAQVPERSSSLSPDPRTNHYLQLPIVRATNTPATTHSFSFIT